MPGEGEIAPRSEEARDEEAGEREGGGGEASSSLVETLGPVFGRTDFSRIFIFELPDFFRGFCHQIFSPHFRGEKVSREILQQNPRQNPPNFTLQKSPRIFCRGARPMKLEKRLACEIWQSEANFTAACRRCDPENLFGLFLTFNLARLF